MPGQSLNNGAFLQDVSLFALNHRSIHNKEDASSAHVIALIIGASKHSVQSCSKLLRVMDVCAKKIVDACVEKIIVLRPW